jgi:DNA-binding transcriptional regulator YiaG
MSAKRTKRVFTAAELARLREQLQVKSDEAAALLRTSEATVRNKTVAVARNGHAASV